MTNGGEAIVAKLIYACIGAAGALLPYAFRDGAFGVRPDMTQAEKEAAKFRAGLCVLGGFMASLTLTDVSVTFLTRYLTVPADQLQHGAALFIGLSFMQFIEVVANWWRSRGSALLDKYTGVRKD